LSSSKCGLLRQVLELGPLAGRLPRKDICKRKREREREREREKERERERERLRDRGCTLMARLPAWFSASGT
jgi:hypothetical protein